MSAGARARPTWQQPAACLSLPQLLLALSEWMHVRLVEHPTDLHIPSLLDADALLGHAGRFTSAFVGARNRNEETLYALLALNERALIARRACFAQYRKRLAVERRLSILSLVQDLAPVVHSTALSVAAHTHAEDDQWSALRSAAHARGASATLKRELHHLHCASATSAAVPDRASLGLNQPSSMEIS